MKRNHFGQRSRRERGKGGKVPLITSGCSVVFCAGVWTWCGQVGFTHLQNVKKETAGPALWLSICWPFQGRMLNNGERDEFFSGEGGKGFDGFASHALGINLGGNGNEILLTREREMEGRVRWVGGGMAAAPGIFPRKVCIFKEDGPLLVNSSTKAG